MNDTFMKVEKLFTDELYRNTESQTDLNFCCDEDDEKNIIAITNHIKQTPEFSILSERDIFIVLIFIYYSLRFNEQTEDWLDIKFLENNLQNKELGNQLYLQITTGDIMINGTNLSSAIRRYIMELNGGQKSKHRKSKHRKSRNRKSKHRKTRNRKSRFLVLPFSKKVNFLKGKFSKR